MKVFVKLHFKKGALSILVLNILAGDTTLAESKAPVVFSGVAQAWQRRIVTNFLQKSSLHGSSLILWETRNGECQINKRAILQFCFKEGEIKVIRSEKERIRKTLGRLIKYAQTQKAHQNGGPE